MIKSTHTKVHRKKIKKKKKKIKNKKKKKNGKHVVTHAS